MNRADELWESTKSPTVRNEHEEELEELFILLQPAYLTLRAMGYNHYDLTGIIL